MSHAFLFATRPPLTFPSVCVVSALRLPTVWGFFSDDPAWDGTLPALWSCLEVSIGIISACLPLMRPVASRVGQLSVFTHFTSRSEIVKGSGLDRASPSSNRKHVKGQYSITHSLFSYSDLEAGPEPTSHDYSNKALASARTLCGTPTDLQDVGGLVSEKHVRSSFSSRSSGESLDRSRSTRRAAPPPALNLRSPRHRMAMAGLALPLPIRRPPPIAKDQYRGQPLVPAPAPVAVAGVIPSPPPPRPRRPGTMDLPFEGMGNLIIARPAQAAFVAYRPQKSQSPSQP